MSMRLTASVGVAVLLGLVLATGSLAAAPHGPKPKPTPTPPTPTPTAPATGPSTPTNLRITASTETSVSLAWNASSSSASTWWYCVQNNLQGCIRVDPPGTTMTWPNLMPNRTFSFTVYAVSSNGKRSGDSNAVTFTTPPDSTAPSPAPVLSPVLITPARISVSWTASTDNTSQVWHTLLMDGAPQFSDYIGLRSWTTCYVDPGSTHTLQVTARDAWGNVATSNVLTVTTPAKTDFTPPSAPTNLHLTFQSSPPEAWLAWTASTDDTDPQSLILYETWLNGVLVQDGLVGGTWTVTYCRDTAPMEIVLRAVDSSGNRSGPSNVIQFSCV